MYTHSIVEEFVSRTAPALGADKEQVLIREILQGTSALAEIKDEVGSCPDSAQADVLEVVVNDKTSQTKDTGVVPSDAGRGGVGDVSNWVGGLNSEVSKHEVQPSRNPGDVADVKGVDLGYCCSCY